jgi:carbon monoxide dehydrogenase subunit G
VLSDIETVASCMPGASITEQVDDQTYKGKVKAKVGPATMAFDGVVEVLGIDHDNQELRLTSKGQDSKGTSSAQMDLTARVLESDSGGSELKGEATVTVNGKLASLGGRMMTQVADQILNQFGKNYAARSAALADPAAADQAQESQAGEPGSGAAAPGAGSAAAAGEARPINGLAFAWSVILGFLKSLFGKNKKDAHVG